MGEGGLTPLGGLIRFLGGSNVQKILTPPPLGASATPRCNWGPKTTKNCPGAPGRAFRARAPAGRALAVQGLILNVLPPRVEIFQNFQNLRKNFEKICLCG